MHGVLTHGSRILLTVPDPKRSPLKGAPKGLQRDSKGTPKGALVGNSRSLFVRYILVYTSKYRPAGRFRVLVSMSISAGRPLFLDLQTGSEAVFGTECSEQIAFGT